MSNRLTSILGNIIYQRDNAQQIFYFANQEVEPACNYTYDPLYRLLTATGREMTALQMPTQDDFVNNIPCPNTASNAMQNYTQNYSYDALGNILQMSSQNQWTRDYIYDTATNRLLRHTQQLPNTYSYDAHGNMLTMPHLTSMSWDYLDQLHSATNGTFSSYYNYDAEGNRTRKVVVKGNIVEIRYYIGNYELYQKHVNGSLDFERKTINISDDEKVFLRIEQKIGENEVIRYQYDNHLGSACLELDENASIISYEEYHPFGTTSYRSGRSETEVSLKRYKYCGKERDEETGLYYYGMRYYAAWICRFVSVDPLQFKYPELTPFQYASNSPVTMIDLDGMEGVKFSTIERAKINGTNIPYWKVVNSSIIPQNQHNDINNVMERMKKSPSFNALYKALSIQGDVNIDINSTLINGYGAGGSQPPGLNQGGVIVLKPIETYQPNTVNSIEFVLTEELFHQFQNIKYGITIESTINQKNTRTVMEIEAEAKVFVKLVLDELKMDFTTMLTPSYLSYLFYGKYLISDICNQEDKEIKGKLFKSYIDYFNQFSSSMEDASQLMDSQHIYKSTIQKNEEVKVPEAFNELIKNR